MTKKKGETAQCQYHFGSCVEGCRSIQLTHKPRSGEWQAPILICPDCREYLRGEERGLFRYVKEPIHA